MFSRNSNTAGAAKPSRSGAPGLSFIGPEVTIGGDVTTAAQLHVDGRIEGHVRCAGLSQGAGGTIAGNITAEEARIAGLVEGTVEAKTLIVEASGRVTGDVTYETISIAAGAQIEGRLARRAALTTAVDAPAMLIATPKDAPAGKNGADLFPAGRKRASAA
jgi:cytoskeletal protein CcmA (bactofilin family)